MRKLIKWLATGLGSLLALMALGILYVSLMVDPNQYKPDVESMAEGAGVELAIEGAMEWQFFPLGVRINQVNFAQQNQSVAGHIAQLALGVNWLALATSNSESYQLPLSSIAITNARLLYAIPDQLPLQISNINLNISDMALDGSAFPVQLSLQAPRGLQFSFDADMGISFFEQKVTGFSASAFKLRLDKLQLTGDIQGTDNLAKIQGSINTQGFNLLGQLSTIKQFVPDLYIPEMVDPKALTDISFKSHFNIEPEGISEAKITVVVDGQPFDINLLVDQPRYKLTTLISGDNFNSAPYLPKPSSAASNATLFAPLAIPLALWHGQSQMELQLGKLELRNMTVSNIYANLFGNQSIFELTSFNADAFDGQINATAKLDMRSSVANFNLRSSISNLDLGAMITARSSYLSMDGILSLKANIQGSGNDTFSIINSLKGGGQFDILSPLYSGMNIEQSVCGAAALFGGGQSDKPWPEGTQLDDLAGNFRFDQGKLMVTDYQTGAGNISLSGNSTMDLLKQTYRLNTTVLLNKSKTSSTGCSVNKLLQNRQIPFRCDGKLGEEVNCRPESNLLKTFIKQSALNNLNGKISEKLDLDEQVNPLQQLLDKNLNPQQ